MDFHEESYKAHMDKPLNEGKYHTWKNEDTVDFWRHQRMYNLLIPFLNHYQSANWLTIGDGRFGSDAHFISRYTNQVLATDINEVHLKIAKEDGYITDYKIENAEKLSFPNESFDFVFCKESYHHFPRPPIALYEMIRVAKKAVFLIEPNDQNVPPLTSTLPGAMARFWQDIKNAIKRFLGRDIYYEFGNYEPSGNYVYTISRRELEKIALGINLPIIITKGLNDHYIEGVEFEKISENGPLIRSLKKQLHILNKRSNRGLVNPNILLIALFKENFSTELKEDLEMEQYEIINLPRNPYLGD